MSKKLVLAEKPSVGRDLAKVLKCNKNGNGFIEGNIYDLVVKRFISVMMPPYIYTESTIKIEVEGESLIAVGTIEERY
ncbi:MAG: hypothetical protein RSB70_03755 [Clostridium sp.]